MVKLTSSLVGLLWTSDQPDTETSTTVVSARDISISRHLQWNEPEIMNVFPEIQMITQQAVVQNCKTHQLNTAG